MADEPKKPFSQIVAENLITQLKAGTAPWQRPWKAGDPSAFLPMNPTTGKRYKGINAIHLMSQFQSDPRWMTYKQAAAIGAQVRKGSKSTRIQIWKFTDERVKEDATGKPYKDKDGNTVKEIYELERPRVFSAYVFNGTQIDGLPPLESKKQEQDWQVIERAEHILAASGASITHTNGDRAFYRPATDSITLPEKSQFPSADNYYATALHELGHWTGHHTRLDRDLAHPFGSEGYAKEELRAEIASMILGVELGIGHDPGQHAAYVKSWIKALEEDHMEIFRAAADAEKIHGYVMAFEQQQVQSQTQQQDSVVQPELQQSWRVVGRNAAVVLETASAVAAHAAFTTDADNAINNAATGKTVGSHERYNDGSNVREWLASDFADALESERQHGVKTTPLDAHAEAFIDSRNQLLNWQTGAEMPDSWQGLAQREGSYWYIGRDIGERSFTVLNATTLTDAKKEAAIAEPLEVDVTQVLNDPDRTFTHFEAFKGDTLESALRSRGLTTIGNVTGRDPEQFYDHAITALSPVFGIDPDYTETDNAYLERKGLVSAFRDEAERLVMAQTQSQAPGVAQEAVAGYEVPEIMNQGGRLVDRLQQAGVMSHGDALVTDARRDFILATAATLEVDGQRLGEVSEAQLLFKIPPTWTGEVQARAMVEVEGNVVPAEDAGLPATMHSVYARTLDGDGELTYEWLIDFPNPEQAQQMADRLALIDAYSQPDRQERDRRLALASTAQGNRAETAAVGPAAPAPTLSESDKHVLDSLLTDPLSRVPETWTGELAVLPLITVDGEVTSAESAGVAPEFHGLYVATADDQGEKQWLWLADYTDPHEAEALALRLDERAAELETEGRLAKLAPVEETIATEKVWLDVPFKQKDAAKEAAGRLPDGSKAIDFDRGEKRWFAYPGANLAKLTAWLPATDTPQRPVKSQAHEQTEKTRATEQAEKLTTLTPLEAPEASEAIPPQAVGAEAGIATEKTWLAIPYSQREAAKAIAGRLADGSKAIDWDKANNSWFANPGADLNKLKMWLPENVQASQGPPQTPQDEFADALRAMGCIVEGEHPIMDGQRHRVRVEGDKAKQDKQGGGTYIGHLPEPGARMANGAPEIPAGYIKNHRTQVEMRWKAKGYTFTDEEKAQMHAAAAAKLQKREAEQNAAYERVAKRVAAEKEKLAPITEPTPYMVKKGLVPQQGTYTDADKLTMFVPVYDVDGKQWSMQYINSDGSSKRFAKDSRKEACFHVIGGNGIEALADAPAIVIGEGYSTTACAKQVLGFPAVTAFDSGNLKAVAKAISEKYPDKPLVFLGDDDTHLVNHPQVRRNTGRVKAEEAARELGGTVVFPIFAPGEQAGDPAGFTDFNDLATKSVLGPEGLERQVKGFVDDVIAKHQSVSQMQEQVEERVQERVQTPEVKRTRSARM